MTTIRAHSAMSYQSILRIIGAHVDAQGGQSVSIVEGREVFTVRYRQSPEGETVSVNFRHADLSARGARLDSGRGQSEAIARRRDSAVSYQDSLRALGYELDQTAARNLVIDEREGATNVRYVYVHPSARYIVQQRHVSLLHSHLETLRSESRRRRGMEAGARLALGEAV